MSALRISSQVAALTAMSTAAYALLPCWTAALPPVIVALVMFFTRAPLDRRNAKAAARFFCILAAQAAWSAIIATPIIIAAGLPIGLLWMAPFREWI